LIVIYGDKVQGVNCPCWKPNQQSDVRKGETINVVVSSCAGDLSTGLYIGVQGIVPTPTNTSWTCIPGYSTPVRLNVAGVVECMSFNGRECYWNDGPCSASKLKGNGSPIIPLNCIDVRRQIWGTDGLSYDGKWCDDTLRYFLDKFHRYSQNEFVLSIEQAPITTKDMVTRLEPGIVDESHLNSGEIHYYELVFPRTNLLNSSLVIQTEAHANSGFEFSYGILTGQSGSSYDCLELGDEQVCSPTDYNKGQCIFLYNSCSWRNDKDGRRMMVKVKRNGASAGTSGPTDLYNIQYSLSTKVPTLLKDNVPVAGAVYAKEYVHFRYEVTKEQLASYQSLVIEVYFDATRELEATEQLELFLNTPTTTELAGDLNDCYCHQMKWANSKRVVATIHPCELQVGTYRFSVRTSTFKKNSLRTKFTINAYAKKMLTPLPWDSIQVT
jgi:hypothetical protein